MSTLNSIFNIGLSGVNTAQAQLSVVSDNISNVNTTGYIRKTLRQSAIVQDGVGAGVATDQVQLAASTYLQQASIEAASASGQTASQFELYDNIQSQFGDPTNANTIFNLAGTLQSSLASLSETPGSTALRQTVLTNLQGFLSEAGRINDQIQQVRKNADTRIAADVQTINALLKHIADLNSTVAAATVSGTDSSGALNAQSQDLDQLSKLIDVTTQRSPTGALQVRTKSGTTLVGNSAATLSFAPAGTVNGTTAFNPIYITGDNGAVRDLTDNISSGELRGLLDVRDKDAVAVSQQLSEYAASYATQLNSLSNQATAVPAPNALTGKNISQTLTEGVTGFTGQAHLYVTDATGVIQKQVRIDFSTHQYYVDGAASGNSFTDATFQSDINAALGGAASLSFSNGTLSLTAASASNGVSVADDATSPAVKAGQGFSQFFGLNDLISSAHPIDYATGLTASSNHGFTSGSTIGFSVTSGSGAHLGTINVSIPSGTDMTSLITALNSSSGGLGQYGSFSLDSQGRLSFTGNGTPPAQLSVVSDNTARNGTGEPFSRFFGIGGAASNRASQLAVNANLLNNSARFPTAKINQAKATGQQALLTGDSAGVSALSQAGDATRTFAKAGNDPGGATTLSQYAANLAGQVGNQASNYQIRKSSAANLVEVATTRRQSSEGVNLDQELVSLTTFQQAYTASGRVIQAAKDMYDTLLSMIQ